MANTPGSGNDTENLKIGVDTSEAVTAATNLDNLDKTVKTTVLTVDQLAKSFDKQTDATKKTTEATESAIRASERANDAQKEAARLKAELLKLQQAELDAGTAYLAKLEEMVATFNMTTGALQRYKAEQLGVLAGAEPLISAMEQMAAATKKYGVVITEVGQIDAARAQWEKENIAILNGQRVDATIAQANLEKTSAAELNGQRVDAAIAQQKLERESAAALNGQRIDAKIAQAQMEKEAAAELNGQRVQALADQAALEESARTSLNAQRIRSIRENQIAEVEALKATAAEKLQILEKEAAAETALNAQRIRSITANAEAEAAARTSLDAQRIRETTANAEAEEAARTALNAQRIRAISDAEKAAVALAEKEAIEEIRWNEMSVKTRIAQLELLKAYQASSAISPATTAGSFSSAAFKDLGNLEALIKQYNDGLGHTKTKQGEATESTNALSKAFENNRVRTEAIVILHEALQGRFTRIPGSLMVMMEYLNAASVSMTGFSVTGLLVAGAVAAIGYEMYRGQAQQKAFNDAIARTNDYAGVTRGGLEQLAQSVGKLHGNYTEAYEAAAELTASGRFTGEQIKFITAAVVDLDHAFGTKVNVSIKEFESLAVKGTASAYGGSLQVSKALEVLDEKYHFVNASLMQEVINLEQEGKAREASAVAMEAYGKEAERAAQESAENIGWIQQAWNGVTWAIKTAAQAMADIGKRTSLERDVVSTYSVVKKDKDGNVDTDTEHMGQTDIMRLERWREALQAVADAQREADEREKTAATQSAATHALMTRAIEDKRLMKKTEGELQDAIKRNNEENAIIEKANPGYMVENADYLKDRELAIIKAHSQAVQKEKNDGRKTAQADQLAAAKSEYDLIKEEADHTEQMLKEWADAGQITRQTEYNSIAAARQKQLDALEAMKKAELAIMAKYKPLNDTDAVANTKRINDVTRNYLLSAQKIRDATDEAQQKVITKAVKDEGRDYDSEIKGLVKKVEAQKLFNAEIGKTAEEKELAKKQIEDEKADQDELLLILLQIQQATEDLGPVEAAVNAKKIKDLTDIVRLRKEDAALLQSGADASARSAAQKELDKQYKEFNKKIADDLASAIVDGGGKGFKKLIRDMEMAFAKAILKPIIQPVADGISNLLYSGATQAGGTATGVGGAGGTGEVGSAINLANAAASAYKALSGGFAGLSGTVASGVTTVLDKIGLESAINTSAAGSYAGLAAGYAGGAFAGKALGSAISGQYGIDGHGSAVVNVATLAGAVIGGPIGAAIGGAIGGMFNRAFGMGDKNVTSMGMSGTITQTGVTGTNYSNWHQDGGWFRSDKNGTDNTALNTDVVNSFTSGMATMKAVSSGFAKSLGVDSKVLDNYSKDFNITLTNDAAANQKAVTDFFTSMGDDIATKLVPTLSAFAQSGETASVTLQRLAEEFQATDAIATSLGKTATSMFRGTGLDTAAARERVLAASGGSSNAVSQAASYAKNFLTEAQRLAPVVVAVDTAMSSLGYTGIDTRAKFAALVEGLVTSGAIFTDAGAKQYASLMAVADAFATTHAAAEDLSASVQAVADEQKSLSAEYDKLVLNSTQLRVKERAAIQDSNKALFDQVKARGDLSVAYDRESSALKQTIADNKAFRTTLMSYRDGLMLGSLSAATPTAKLAESQRQYVEMLAKAKAGDKDAMSGLTAAADAFLTADQVIKASSQDYINDRDRVMQDMQDLADTFLAGQSDAEKQLEAMDKSVSQLISINEGVKSVADILTEISRLPSAGGSALSDAPLASSSNIMQSPIVGLATMFDSMASSNQALATEVAGLRADQAQQTGDMIMANAEVTSSTATTIAEGTVRAAKYSNWKIAQMDESEID